jgi:hypothetical protein
VPGVRTVLIRALLVSVKRVISTFFDKSFCRRRALSFLGLGIIRRLDTRQKIWATLAAPL